jgi:glycosyltransferase involved in cell wall biosynthesis
MKIAMILDTTFPPDPRVENETASLIAEGHQVILFCFSYNKKFKKHELFKGVQVKRYFCNKITYKLSALAYTFTLPFYHIITYFLIRNFLSVNKVDVIHIHDIQIARSVFWANRKKLPVVLDLHENRPEIMKFYSHVNSKMGKLLIYPKLWKKFEYRYIKKADKVIVVTESAKQYYLKEINKLNPDKFIVLPNVIRKSFFQDYTLNKDILNRFKGEKNILYVGETGLRRGTLDLIKAIDLIKAEIPDILLIIVGKSKTDYVLRNEIKKRKLERYVVMEGWKDFRLFQSYMHVSKLGLIPLHRNIHHDTTFANKLFQYIAMGLPVVASDSTAQKRVINKFEFGLIHDAKDINGIKENVVELLTDENLYNELSTNARKAAEEHLNWKVKSKEFLSYYRSLESSKIA